MTQFIPAHPNLNVMINEIMGVFHFFFMPFHVSIFNK